MTKKKTKRLGGSGDLTACLCRACLGISFLDLEGGALRCTTCDSPEVVPLGVLHGNPCPKCGRGNVGVDQIGWI